MTTRHPKKPPLADREQSSGGLSAWLGIKRSRTQTPPLGERELAILDLLWQRSPCSAKDILALLPEKNISLNTVQSTIERLHRKQLLTREKVGRQYLYSPTQSKADFIGQLLCDIADEIAGGEMAPMLSGFQKFLESQPQEKSR